MLKLRCKFKYAGQDHGVKSRHPHSGNSYGFSRMCD